MQLTYYNNKSDKRYLNKTLESITLAGHSNPVNISILDNCSVVNPTFKMVDKDIYLTANYCWVDTLRRYYYIDDIELSNGFAYLHCTVDVLMTYKEEIKQRRVVVKRQENNFNLYQVDDKVTLLNYECVKTVSFPTNKGFDATKQEFVLCTIGNTNA